MKTPRRIRTVVVTVPADSDWLNGDRPTSNPRMKPSNLLPWSDPTIASLVEKLQEEVRQERCRSLEAEAEMPWNEPFEYEYESQDNGGGFSIDTSALLNL